MIEINLVPDVKQELIRAERVRAAVISIAIVVGLAAAGVVILLALYVYGLQTVRGAVDDNQIKDENTKLTSVEDLSKTLTIQNQLSKIAAFQDQRKMTSRLFDVLTAIIPPAPNNMSISSLSIDTEARTIAIEGQAANSYPALEVFKKTIEGAKVRYADDTSSQEETLASDISTSDVSFGEDASGAKVLRFALTFTYSDKLFSPSANSVAVIISNQGNVTDSYLGVPQSIFADRASDPTGGN